jgi:hypothetical protein
MKILILVLFVSMGILSFLTFKMGVISGKESVVIPKCEPKKVWTAPSTEELGRMYRARVRMEKVK